MFIVNNESILLKMLHSTLHFNVILIIADASKLCVIVHKYILIFERTKIIILNILYYFQTNNNL